MKRDEFEAVIAEALDGLPLALSNRGYVLIGGKPCPVLGRVSMDYVGVDCGDEVVSVGDEAILFGEANGVRLPVEEVAQAAGTIAYELMCGVSARVPRHYID